VPRRRLAAIAVLSLAGLSAFTVSARGADEVRKDESFLTAETAGVLNMEGGDCFDDPVYDESQGVEVANHQDCASADNQVYGFFQVEGDAFDRAGLAKKGWDGCRVGFTTYWKNAEDSGLDFYPVLPTRVTWEEQEDRTVMCVVYNSHGKLEGAPLPTQ
jgi:hypothetical protein